MRYFPILLLLLCFSGCDSGPRLSKPQAQDLSDARAASDALMMRVSQGLAQVDPHTLDLLRACTGFLFSATANLAELPPPRIANPQELVTSATAAKEAGDAGEKARMTPSPGFSWGLWGAVGGGALFALHFGLRIAGGIPGVGGVVAGLVTKIWDTYAPASAKAADEKTAVVARHAVAFGHAVTEITKHDARLAAVVEKVKDRAKETAQKLGVQGEIAALLAETKRHSSLSVVSDTQK